MTKYLFIKADYVGGVRVDISESTPRVYLQANVTFNQEGNTYAELMHTQTWELCAVTDSVTEALSSINDLAAAMLVEKYPNT